MFLVLLLAFAALGNAQLIVRTVCGPGSPISGNSAVSSGESINPETGASYTYLNSDCGKLVTHSNGGSISGTLPQANSTTFRSGWFMDVQNIGVGTLTITPTTSTIDGAASLVFTTGQGARIVSNGADYSTQRGGAGSVISGGTVTSVGFSASPGTVTGSPITTSGTINYSFTAANVVSLFTGCSGTLYLGADGACHSPGTGTVTSVATTSPITGGTITTTGTIACATCTTNASALTANLPVIGAGSQAVAVGTRSGNTTAFVTTTGTQTSGNCVNIDANGNHVASGSACGAGAATLISRQILSGTASTVTFSSIAGYTNLTLIITARGDTAATTADIRLQFNGDTGTNYNFDYVFETNGACCAAGLAGQASTQAYIFAGNISAASVLANAPGILEVSIPDYSGSTFLKVVRGAWTLLNGAAITSPRQVGTTGGMWNNAAAITSIVVSTGAGNFIAGSVFELWGQ